MARLSTAIGIFVVLLCAPTLASDPEIDNPLDTVNAHFETASALLGKGVVQMNTRQEGPDGDAYTVFQFDCVKRQAGSLYRSTEAPEAFPLNAPDLVTLPFKKSDIVVPFAQHACKKHGHPLAEW